MKAAWSIVFFLLACFCQTARSAEKFDISGYTIVSRTDPAFGSGIIQAWSVFFASKKDEDLIVFYTVYFGKTQSLPTLGQVCDIQGEWGRVDEWLGDRNQDIERGRIMKRHQCRWPEPN